MNELWTRSRANVRDGKLEDLKRFAGELVSAIRENDADTLNYAIFLDEPGRVAVIIEQYASSAGWLAHSANLEPLMLRLAELCEFTEVEVYGDPTPEARAALDALGARYYQTLLAL
jgi:quinol monooxygenase YgiN